MLDTPMLRTTLLLMALLAGCAAPFSSPASQEPIASPSGDWRMSLTQTGGFAGVHLTVDVSSDGRLTAEDQRAGRKVTQQLSRETVASLGQMNSRLLLSAPKSRTSPCADCFLYDLKASGSGRNIQIQADDTTLADSGAAELIRYLQLLRDGALRGQP